LTCGHKKAARWRQLSTFAFRDANPVPGVSRRTNYSAAPVGQWLLRCGLAARLLAEAFDGLLQALELVGQRIDFLASPGKLVGGFLLDFRELGRGHETRLLRLDQRRDRFDVKPSGGDRKSAEYQASRERTLDP
jgi:hypothetical protein